jgi:hypothetical protein
MTIKQLTLFLTLISMILVSCSKEKYPRVEYEVTCTSSSIVTYTMVTGSITTETVSGSWSKSFRHSQGANVYLRATHTGLGSTTISIYVNKELLWTESSNIPGETIQIFEAIP